ENGHPDHMHHAHTVNHYTRFCADGGLDAVRAEVTVTSETTEVPNTQYISLRHGGGADGQNDWPGALDPEQEAHPHADTDNRPPYYVVAFIMRIT
ncbi:MAG TPA: hypothetical protein VM389_04500, partial [Phycisphaerae bacterium]|nr:hypothetical protein [Phycisphaerae bacterium]